MSKVSLTIIITTAIEIILFTGFGLTTFCLLFSRVGYLLNNLAMKIPVKRCLVWESLSLGWVILKCIIFKSVHFDWKYTLILLIIAIINISTMFYDSIEWEYVVETVKEDNEDEGV